MDNKFNALILCGGKGTRLKKIGKKIPKSLLNLGNKPMLTRIINLILKERCELINISGGYLFKKIKFFINNDIKNNKIKLWNDGEISILSRIKKNLLRNNKHLIVFYGDEYADINFKKLIKSHIKSKKLITLTTYKYKSSFGFLLKDKNSYRFVEKPYLGNYNIGFMIFNYNNIKHIKNFINIENYIARMCLKNQVNEYVHDGYHITFNTMAEFKKASENIDKINEKK